MTAESNDNILNLCIDVCADFERKTGVKTADTHGESQKETAQRLGLSLKEVKKWHDASKAARDIVTKLEADRVHV